MTDRPQRILVIDDEPENQLLIRTILRGEGYEVETRDDGVSGLAVLERERFDLVLLDVMMPDLNGLQVFERMQSNERLRCVPVIMLTALAQRRDYEQALALGVKDYITKPFEPSELIVRLRAAMTCITKESADV